MAKPLANGYPIGAVMMREEIAQAMSVGKFWDLLLMAPFLTPVTVSSQEPTGQLSVVPRWRVQLGITYCNVYRTRHSLSPRRRTATT